MGDQSGSVAAATPPPAVPRPLEIREGESLGAAIIRRALEAAASSDLKTDLSVPMGLKPLRGAVRSGTVPSGGGTESGLLAPGRLPGL
jgi:hypothetical protein